MILPDALANRRSWIGIKIAVKLAGAGLFDHVAEMVASGSSRRRCQISWIRSPIVLLTNSWSEIKGELSLDCWPARRNS